MLALKNPNFAFMLFVLNKSEVQKFQKIKSKFLKIAFFIKLPNRLLDSFKTFPSSASDPEKHYIKKILYILILTD